MLRDKNLIPLSHQHQHALALCVRIDRASPISDRDLSAWQTEITQHFQTEIKFHFAAEEQVLFPVARRFEGLGPLVDELLADHATLREHFDKSQTGRMCTADLSAFAQRMSAHIRKEERQLFERLQALMSPEELEATGRCLESVLKDAAQACSVPIAATKLLPEK